MNAVVLAALVALVACSDDKRPPPAPDPNGIELLYAGSEPRRLLRYEVVKGSKIPIEIAVDVDLDASGRGGPLPTVIVASELSIEDVLPDRSARIRMTIASVRASDRPNSTLSAETMMEHMQAMRGTSLVGTLAQNGVIRDLHAEAGEKLPPALAQQLETISRSFQQIAMPLPHVPVGSGAAWRHQRAIEQSGLSLFSVTTVVASSVTDHAFTYTSTTSLGGRDQTVTLSGHAIETKNIGGTGNGKGTIDLSTMAMTGETTLAFHGDMTADGQTDEMAMTMTTRVGSGARADPGAGSAAPPIADEPELPDDLGAPDNTEHSGENEPAPGSASP